MHFVSIIYTSLHSNQTFKKFKLTFFTDNCHLLQVAFVAQWLEHLSRKQGVVSSILTEGIFLYLLHLLHNFLDFVPLKAGSV